MKTLLLIKEGGRPDHLLDRYLQQNADDIQFDILEASISDNLAQQAPRDVVLLSYYGCHPKVETIQSLAALFPSSVLVVLAESATAHQIVEGVKVGANEFLIRSQQNIKNLARKVLCSYELTCKQRLLLDHSSSQGPKDSPYVGATMERIRRSIPNIIQSAITTIHVAGETGTGKEVVAELFRESLHPDTPFINVNCGAITPTLMESEFFGHIKGSFTGAVGHKEGLLEKASGGFLFLDEVANLTREAQAALLRAIENQEVIRVGETKPRPISVRFISATNENLEHLVADGRFRRDLWQRLCERVIQLPPLRQRKEEIPALIASFAENMAGGPYQISAAAMEVLSNAPWDKGNVRQLRNCLRAMTECQVNQTLSLPSIPIDILQEVRTGYLASNQGFGSPFADEDGDFMDANKLVLRWDEDDTPSFDDLAEQLLLKMIRARTQGQEKISLRKLASSMGMVRNTLSNRMKALARKNILCEPEMLQLIGETH